MGPFTFQQAGQAIGNACAAVVGQADIDLHCVHLQFLSVVFA
jgi:hypothetical protein